MVHGRKHSYRLYTKMLNEAMRWVSAIQGVIENKAPIETPTQQLIRDIKVNTVIYGYTFLILNSRFGCSITVVSERCGEIGRGGAQIVFRNCFQEKKTETGHHLGTRCI